MPLDIFNNEKYQSQDYDTKLKVADSYFRKKIETSEKYKSLDVEKQAMVKDKYFADNVGMPERSWTETARDFPMQIGAGIGSLVETTGDVYGLVSGNMDNKISQVGKTVSEGFRKEYSKPLKQLEEISQKEIDKETGEFNKFIKTIENSVSNPALASKYIVESLPMLLATGGAGRAAKIITGSAKAGTWSAIGAGGALQGADMGSSAYDTLMKLDDNYWNNIPEYQEAVKNGTDPLQAKNDISTGIARVVAGVSGTLSIGANKLISGGDILENVLTGNSIGGGILKGGIKGTIGEGLTESLEEGGGQAFQNVGVQQVNPNQATFQGVGQAGGTGLVAGGLTGGVAGAVGGEGNTQPIQQQTQPQPKTADEILATPMKDLVAEAKQSKIFGDSKAKSEAMAVDVGEVNYDIPQEAQLQQMDSGSSELPNNQIDVSQNLDLSQQQEPIQTEELPQEVIQPLDNIEPNINEDVEVQPQENNNQEPPQEPDHENTLWNDSYLEKLNTMEQKAKESGNNKAVFEIARAKQKLKESRIRTADENGYVNDNLGGIKAGDVFRTASGRLTTPFPKQKQEIYATRWTIENAIAEAEARGDKFNATQFKALDPKNFTPADIEAANYYLHGENQPVVQKPFLKPLNVNQANIKQDKKEYNLDVINEFEGLAKATGNNTADVLSLEKPTNTKGIRNSITRYENGKATERDFEILDAVEKFMKYEGDNFRAKVNDRFARNETLNDVVEQQGFTQLDNGDVVDENGKLLFSKKQEDIKDLMVQHNLSEDNLKYAKKGNGLLVPSLAITKGETPLTGFGEITLLGDKDLVNPKGYAKTKVFGADIYSPRFPKENREYKTSDIRKIDKELEKYTSILKNGEIYSSNDIDNLADNQAMKMKFLEEEKGVSLEIPKQKNPNEELISKAYPEEYNYSIQNKGIDWLSLYKEENFKQKVVADLNSRLEARGRSVSYTDEQISNIARDRAQTIDQIGRSQGKPDYYAMRDLLRQEIEKFGSEYKDYVENFKNKYDYKSFFYDNNKKKKFDESTILKYLTSNLRGGENFNYGAGSVRAMVTPEFKTLEQIKKAKEKLVTPEDFEPIAKSINDELLDIATSIAAKGGNQFINNDIAIEFIQDYSKRGRRAIPDYDVDVNNESIKRIDEFLNKLKELPTEYFEAKITRDVSPAEFRAAVVPENVSKETLDYLTKQGLKIKTYKKGDEADRKRAISEATKENDLLFSRFKQKNSTTVAEAIEQAKKLLGKKYFEVTRGIEFLQSANDLPPNIKRELGLNDKNIVNSGGIARGIFDPRTNKIYLIADTMKANEVQGVILHELLHRAINGIVKNGQSRLDAILGSNLKPLTDRLNKLAENGDERVTEAFKRVKAARVPKENQLEETMTYLLENYTNDKNNSPLLNKWIKDVIQAIKDFIRKVAINYGIEPNWFISRMNVDDIATVLRSTAIDGKENLSKGNILTSKKSRLDEWHKDSSPFTKNEDGSPKVFYHQTSKEAAKSIYSTKFDINKVGARGSDNAVPDGFFFKTNDNDIGVGTSTKENIEQIPVYLKIKNPFMAKDRNSLKWQISAESKRYKNLLDEAKQIDNYYGKINDELEAQAKEVGYKLRADRENKKLTDEYYAISDKLDENLTSWEDAINKNAELSRKEIKDTLQRLGYDGLNLANDEGSFGRKVNTFIAFEPTQIKSVNNQGTFDETNPNILYSKEGFENRQKTKLDTIKKWLSDKTYDAKATKGISSLLYVTTRQQKADMFEKIAPELQVYDDLVESKIAEANRIAKLSGEIAEKTRKWAVKNKAEADKLFKFMGESTISGIDPTKSFKDQKTKAEQFYTYADKVGIEYDNKDRQKLSEERYDFIKAKWDNLSTEAKEIYSTMKDHYERLADKMFIALKNKITEAEIDENSKVKLIDKLRLEFENRKVSGPYFPLMRFGEYVVTGKDSNGELVVERYETPSERDNAADEMAKEGYTDIKKSADTDKQVSLQADTAFMNDVLGKIEKVNPEAFNDISDNIYQLYLKYLPNMSARKSYIHRKGVAGYSDDMLRVFASKTFHLGRQIANINHLDKMQKEINKLEKRVKETGDPKLKAIYDDLLKTHDHIVNPEFAQWQVAATSVGFYWYMTSLSAGILNLSQVALVVFPKLTGKYGANKSMYNLTKSVKDLTTNNLTEDEKAFMEKMKDSGIIDLTMTHDLAGLGDHYNDIKYGPMTTVKRVLAIPQHYSEVANRMVTLLTTYRLAKDKGIADPTKEAVKINYETNFNYTNENRNRLMRHPAMKVVTQFKNYSVQMLYFMLKHSYIALKGDKEAIKTMGTLIAMSFALSGVKGLPLQLYYLIAGVAGSDDPEDELYANIKEVAGEYTDLIWRGVTNYITGADIGGRTGLNDLLLKGPTKEMNTKDTVNFYVTQVLGPTLSIFTNFAVGISDMANGEVSRGIEKSMPKPIKDIIQTYRFGTEGARDYDFKPLVEEFKPSELAVKTIGFQPESLAKVQESNMRVLRAKAKIDNERSDILKRLRKADFKGNEKLWKESMKEIEEFNAKYPNLAIKNDTIRRSLQGADKDRANAENGLNLPPKYRSEIERYK